MCVFFQKELIIVFNKPFFIGKVAWKLRKIWTNDIQVNFEHPSPLS